MNKFSLLTILMLLLISSIGSVCADRPVFDIIHSVNKTMFFNLTELGYTQDTIDLVNRSVLDCFQYWGQPGFALIGTGRPIVNIATGTKLGDAIFYCDSPSTNSSYSIHSKTNDTRFGYRNETSFSDTWLNFIFPAMLYDFNSSTRNSTDWTIYMTFDEGRLSYVPGNDTGSNTVIVTYNNVSVPDTELGKIVNVSTTLRLDDGTTLTNKRIRININGTEIVRLTNEVGEIDYPFIPDKIGLYNVVTTF
ncbi:MAG: hypothetical protein LBD03_04735 [Methanobrevibacter sp.]|jgi:hypothetical protein|nr:hypothetical protein [Candidatus Methanovirga procula]